MEANFTITRVSWGTARIALGSTETVERIHARHRALVFFLQEHSLTVRQILKEDDPLNDESKLMRADLTDKGFKLYQKVEKQWLNGIDRGKDPTDMTIFIKELAKL